MRTNKNLAVIILAAGKGTRMKSDLPKVMQPAAGLPLINWVIKTAEALKPAKIITVVGPDMPDLENAVKPHQTVIQKIRNGTGGAAKIAAETLKDFKGDTLILLGDAPLIKKETLQSLINMRHEQKAGLSLLACHVDNPHGYGRVILEGNQKHVHKIVEHKDANAKERQTTLINTGAFCVDNVHLLKWLNQINNDNAQSELYITDLPEIAAQEATKTAVSIIENEQEIQGCNVFSDLAEIERAIRTHLCDQHMKNGVRIIDPQTTYIHHDTVIKKGSTIEPNVFFDANVTIGQNVTIKAFSHLEGVHIKNNVSIGPFARIRPDTIIEDNVRIGNFVEIKKSNIGEGSKINHLAYVGDCEMGKDVNFSAGAITVNYDGFNKYQTIIGENVMIGSNANLVAPIEIGDGAFIGAGSTLSKNVESNSLTLTREKPKILKGWAKKHRETNKKKNK